MCTLLWPNNSDSDGNDLDRTVSGISELFMEPINIRAESVLRIANVHCRRALTLQGKRRCRNPVIGSNSGSLCTSSAFTATA